MRNFPNFLKVHQIETVHINFRGFSYFAGRNLNSPGTLRLVDLLPPVRIYVHGLDSTLTRRDAHPRMKPEVLVLDEPTAGLDPRSRHSLIRLLGELPLTMLAATHDIRMVQELFPRKVILDEGRVVADGPTGLLMEDVALLEAHGLERM